MLKGERLRWRFPVLTSLLLVLCSLTCAPKSTIKTVRFMPEGDNVSFEQTAQLYWMTMQVLTHAYLHWRTDTYSASGEPTDSACIENDSIRVLNLYMIVTKGERYIRLRLDSLGGVLARRDAAQSRKEIADIESPDSVDVDWIYLHTLIEFDKPKWSTEESLEGSVVTARYELAIQPGDSCSMHVEPIWGTYEGFYHVGVGELVMDSIRPSP